MLNFQEGNRDVDTFIVSVGVGVVVVGVRSHCSRYNLDYPLRDLVKHTLIVVAH